MITHETPERISLCYSQIQIYVPRTIADIARARKLLDMLEDEIIAENAPRLQTNTPPENPPKEVCTTFTTRQLEFIQRVPDTTLIRDEKGNIVGAKSTTRIESKPPSMQVHECLCAKTRETSHPSPIINSDLSCEPFTWDKSKEKSFRTVFFYEHEDGRVMIQYMASRFYIRKDMVETYPYPIPHKFAPLVHLSTNKRTAIRLYREYLGLENQKQQAVIECLENQKQQQIDVEESSEESERMEKLRKAAEINKDRWKDKVEQEMSTRTRELRNIFAEKCNTPSKE